MKDKNEKIRKKAIAALGEYLFYAATQLDDEQADPEGDELVERFFDTHFV